MLADARNTGDVCPNFEVVCRTQLCAAGANPRPELLLRCSDSQGQEADVRVGRDYVRWRRTGHFAYLTRS